MPGGLCSGGLGAIVLVDRLPGLAPRFIRYIAVQDFFFSGLAPAGPPAFFHSPNPPCRW